MYILPVIDGFDLLVRLRASNATCEIPMIAVSSHTSPRFIEKALVAGCRRYLTKPFNIAEFSRAMTELLHDQVPEKPR